MNHTSYDGENEELECDDSQINHLRILKPHLKSEKQFQRNWTASWQVCSQMVDKFIQKVSLRLIDLTHFELR